MPLSSSAHGSTTISPDNHSTMTLATARSEHRGVCPTDSDAIIPGKSQRDGRHKVDKKSAEYMVKSGIAGGIAGCAGKTVVGPLDRVKILFQASSPQFAKYSGSWSGIAIAVKNIYTQGGTRDLYKGHSATLLRIFPYAGIKFLAYEQIRNFIIPNKERETPGRRFLSGALAGCVSVFFTYPLEVIRVRLAFETQSERRNTLTSICKKIYNEHPPRPSPPSPSATSLSAATAAPLATTVIVTSATIQNITPSHGIANFYRGFTPTLWGMLPYAGCSFLAHDSVSDLLRTPALAQLTTLPATTSSQSTYRPPQLVWWAELTSGATAGLISQTVSYPLEIIRRRMQVGGVVGDGHRLGMAEVARRIMRERGWRGFFCGVGDWVY